MNKINNVLLATLTTLATLAISTNTYASRIEVISVKKYSFSSNQMQKFIDRANIMNEKGYIEEESQTAKDLLSMKHEYHGFNNANEKNIYGTDLKSKLSSIKLAFDFEGLKKSIHPENIIGYAVYGTFLKDKGWTGIATYFHDKEIGICHYILNNAELNNSRVKILDITLKKDVNNKATTIDVSGNQHTGYTYQIEWHDKKYFHTLECASYYFNKNLTDKTIELAKKIDLDINK